MNNPFVQWNMKSEVVMVSPDMAQMWLSRNKINRTINRKRVDMYAKEMKEGRWMPHHQGVAFYEDGSFADGQHRLLAIIESGCTVPMVVTRGVPNSSGLMIDTHQQRQTHQSIRISGLADWIDKDEVAVIRLLDCISENKEIKKLSHSEIIAIGEKYKSSIQFAVSLKSGARKYLTTAVTLAAIAAASKYEDRQRLSEFYEVLAFGMPKTSSDKSAILLREWFLQERHGGSQWRLNAIKRTMRAIKAFCERQEISKLYQPSDYIYIPVQDVEIIAEAA
jgi:hypothetical protein